MMNGILRPCHWQSAQQGLESGTSFGNALEEFYVPLEIVQLAMLSWCELPFFKCDVVRVVLLATPLLPFSESRGFYPRTGHIASSVMTLLWIF